MSYFGVTKMAQLTYLTKDMIEEIHSTTVELLANTGVRVSNIEARGLLENVGCVFSEDIVRIPESLVKESLQSVPSKFSMFSRDGKSSFIIGDKNITINPGSSSAHFR